MADKPQPVQLMLIWAAQCFSIVIFVVVAKFGQFAEPAPIDPVMIYTLVPLGLLQSLVGLAAPPPFRNMPSQTGWIVRMAFVEASAIFGLVLHILGAPLPGTALMSWAFLLQMSLVPLEGRTKAWDEARGG